ncbi:hypothetical protein LG047_16830 [Methylocystis sp. WRRC1]|uniref:hypothetical protein n=1 Tax=Methylocystis sp. WRRC1 TaxID=1732014 RepID=UPI001D15A423|nr:hypothetical protein [Methylocystis sp. WRRC1]MCC3246961.1 hypothetical protein [Methylocystis sp. WRRC1]
MARFSKAAAVGAIALAGATVMFKAPATGAATAPTIENLQAAYNREANVAGGLHDKDLRIVGLECATVEGARFACQVGFVKEEEGADRVYLDAALVERKSAEDWKLLRGLCRRLL